MARPFLQRGLLLAGMAVVCWMGMMLVHELGHVVGAWVSGGRVQRVVWHPLVFSRTDVSPNPRPMVVVWAGPVVGVLLPMVADGIASRLRLGVAYLISVFAGFCLVANGAYLALGLVDGVGDVGDMVGLGTPAWVLIGFGLVTVPLGLWRWHVASFRLGFGGSGRGAAIPWRHVVGVWGLGLVLVVSAMVFAGRGA